MGNGRWRIVAYVFGFGTLGCSSVVAELDDAPSSTDVPEVRLGSFELALTAPDFCLTKALQDVSGVSLPADRPELSSDGQRLVYSVEEAASPVFILSTLIAERQHDGAFSSPRRISVGTDGVDSGQLVSWFFPAFVPGSERLLTGKGTISRQADGELDLLSLDARFVEITSDGVETETLATAGGLGFPLGEIPQGARYSPDGSWLAFFADLAPETRGLYLYHRGADRLVRLTTGPDRDPVWSSDGTQLYFYQQSVQDEVAHSALGVVELELAADRVIVATRKLLDDRCAEPTGQEHPAPVVDSDVLFLHEVATPTEPAHLAVRRSCSGFVPVPLRFFLEGREIVDAVRPATASDSPALTFMGRFSVEESYRIFSVEPGAALAVAREVETMECP